MVARTQDDSWDIPIGSVVYTADGRKLGKVTGGDIYGLRVEDGFVFPRAYHVRLSDVERYEDGTLLLNRMMEDLEERESRE